MRIGVLVALALILAGCTGPADPAQGSEEPGTQYQDDERDFTVDQPGTLPVAPPLPGERTIDQAPTWRLGEWWKLRVTDFFQGGSEDIYRIVAGTEHDNYLVGFPVEDFNNFAMVMHHPAYGDINRTDLSYDTHDAPFKHLQFPLQEGDSWETTWQNPGNKITVTVVETDDQTGQAELNLTQSTTTATGEQQTADFGRIVYDAELGDARQMIFNNYGMVEVLEHGYNWTGAVRVPHAHDLVFFHGRLAGGLPIGQSDPGSGPVPTPVGPEEDILVDDFYDRVSFAIIIVDVGGFVGGADASAGYYQQTATAPDGSQYEVSLTPDETRGVKMEFFEHEDPGGTWRLSTIAGGPGQVLFEGIGYHSIDVSLPSGCVLPSSNALHHVTLCKAA